MLDARKIEIEDTFNEPNCRETLLYDTKHLGYFELDFAYGEDHSYVSANASLDEPASMLDEISCFSWLLLGSCKVRNLNSTQDRAKRARGAFGLILFPVPNSTKFCRVGVFFPGLPENHPDGLRLMKRLGEEKSVSII
jgi:hypothetical protein